MANTFRILLIACMVVCLANSAEGFFKKIGNFFKKVANGVVNAVKTVVTGVKTAWNGFVNFLRGPDADDGYNHEIKRMRDGLEGIKKDSDEVKTMLGTITQTSESQNHRLDLFARSVAQLGDFSGGDQSKLLGQLNSMWDSFKQASDQTIEEMARQEGILGHSLAENERMRHENFAKLRGALATYKEGLTNYAADVTQRVRKLATEQLAPNREAIGRATEIMQRINFDHGNMARISSNQKRQIDRMSSTISVKLAAINKQAKQLAEDLQSATLGAANILADKANELRGFLADSLGRISDSLSSTLNDQYHLEMTMRLSKIMNRIEFLAAQVVDLDARYENTKKQMKHNATLSPEEKSRQLHRFNQERILWAEAVIDGYPYSQPIDEFLNELTKMIAGKGFYDDAEPDYEIAGSRNTSIFEIYQGKIRELVDHQQFAVIRSEKELDDYLAVNRDFSTSTSLRQSEAFFMSAFMDSLQQAQSIGFAMAIRARSILVEVESQFASSKNVAVVPVGARFRREVATTGSCVKGIACNGGVTDTQDISHFKNFTMILDAALKLGGLQGEVAMRYFNASSNAVKVQVPYFTSNLQKKAHVLEEKVTLKLDPKLESFSNLLLTMESQPVKDLKPSYGKQQASGMMLSGCRFAELSTGSPQILIQSAYSDVTNASENNENSKTTFYPSKKDVKISKNTLTNSAKGPSNILLGINRVDDPWKEYVCGFAVRGRSDITGYPFTLEISVCSREDAMWLYDRQFIQGSGNSFDALRIKPKGVKERSGAKENVKMSKVNLKFINSMWVRQDGGWTTGIGLSATEHPSIRGELVLNLELESVYF